MDLGMNLIVISIGSIRVLAEEGDAVEPVGDNLHFGNAEAACGDGGSAKADA